MKTFLRVEHGVDKYLKKYYLGMYQSSVAISSLRGERHPMPEKDQELAFQCDLGKVLSFENPVVYLFAFPDIASLKSWVYEPDWLKELHRLGYVLSVYECDDGYHGDTQSIFNFEKAQLKHRLNLLEV